MNIFTDWDRKRSINKEVFSTELPSSSYSFSTDENTNKILEEWSITWGNDYPLFKSYFIEQFKQSSSRADQNRDYNFWGKRRIVRIYNFLILAQLLYIIFLLAVFSSPLWIGLINSIFSTYFKPTFLLDSIQLDGGLIAGIEAVLLTSFAIVFISKNTWLNVKKYQETWARHRLTQYRLLHEMLRFLDKTNPYNNPGNDKRMFIENTLAILDEDMQMFHRNLTDKEVSVLKDFLSIPETIKK
ncbi:MAG: hypothetical protein IKE43_10085 [Coriobacteriales bacterium]|nr:hypothetical protein [Coriobacteriales bacterium]